MPAAKTHLDQGKGRIHGPWLEIECLLEVPLGITPVLSCCSACCCLQAWLGGKPIDRLPLLALGHTFTWGTTQY